MQGVVIQGPTNYVKDVLPLYKNIPNVVWSTWDNEPSNNIELIKKEGIKVIQTPPPTFGGYLNVNFQTISSYKGIKYLKSKGITEALKIRGDIKIDKLKFNSFASGIYKFLLSFINEVSCPIDLGYM